MTRCLVAAGERLCEYKKNEVLVCKQTDDMPEMKNRGAKSANAHRCHLAGDLGLAASVPNYLPGEGLAGGRRGRSGRR